MSYFPDDYFSAREQFLAVARTAGADLSVLELAVTGPRGERLTIDLAWLGPATASKWLIHSCGLHGVEGFAGSAVQQRILQEPPTLAANCALLLVHVLNPYGMSWLRRTNAANVDLNRNFIFREEERPGSAERYAELDPLLNPQRPPYMDLFYLGAFRALLRYGYPYLKSTIAEGQYVFPKGLFFGGTEFQQEVLLYHDWLQVHLREPEQLLVIDLHTGLGKPGEESLLQSLAATPTDILSDQLSAPVLTDGKNTRVLGYRTLGGHEELYRNLFPVTRTDFITHEFGTRSNLSVLRALRRENQWHQFGAGTVDHPVKKELKRAFCPEDPGWRQRLVERGVKLVRNGLDFLAAGENQR